MVEHITDDLNQPPQSTYPSKEDSIVGLETEEDVSKHGESSLHPLDTTDAMVVVLDLEQQQAEEGLRRMQGEFQQKLLAIQKKNEEAIRLKKEEEKRRRGEEERKKNREREEERKKKEEEERKKREEEERVRREEEERLRRAEALRKKRGEEEKWKKRRRKGRGFELRSERRG
ncbi:hypothetical protein L6452_32431 [Arctium lappa]|uniref:Uncharacterized protein n=1 Tax=Arctium lappa TaxID=4217 RepID=A0ACB8Z570_ARCLA|nr:hypothetical protein L6452_32431 [Arctium lappa]